MERFYKMIICLNIQSPEKTAIAIFLPNHSPALECAARFGHHHGRDESNRSTIGTNSMEPRWGKNSLTVKRMRGTKKKKRRKQLKHVKK
jgi:hypothetical protein